MIATNIVPNLYRDSVSLMQLSAALGRLPGVQQASAIMATESNLALLREAGLLAEDVSASPNDLLIAIQGDEDSLLQAALAQAKSTLEQPTAAARISNGGPPLATRSIAMGLQVAPATNLALISVPGEYAAAEAMKALRLGLHVMLFSDNVDLADEVRLKQYGREHDLLVMGPDCGTAIINGIPLAFANVVRRGDIGIVAASGTGLQQVSCLVDRWGEGVSQAIGTGGHDLHRQVGGITMLQGLQALAADPTTRVIVLISKPPAAEVAERVLARAGETGKPVVVNFLGMEPAAGRREEVFAARTLEEAAALAVALARGDRADRPFQLDDDERAQALAGETGRLLPTQRYIRGLYSGGTFCYEALLLLAEATDPVYSNTPVDPNYRLEDVWRSRQHTVIDLGDDTFTRGRPHPMIDHSLRNERIVVEAADPEVAVILLDVVLGYGAHPDPATEMVPAIHRAREIALADGRHLVFVASVCGTVGDPQNLPRQERALHDAGVFMMESNAQAARLAATIAMRTLL